MHIHRCRYSKNSGHLHMALLIKEKLKQYLNNKLPKLKNNEINPQHFHNIIDGLIRIKLKWKMMYKIILRSPKTLLGLKNRKCSLRKNQV